MTHSYSSTFHPRIEIESLSVKIESLRAPTDSPGFTIARLNLVSISPMSHSKAFLFKRSVLSTFFTAKLARRQMLKRCVALLRASIEIGSSPAQPDSVLCGVHDYY